MSRRWVIKLGIAAKFPVRLAIIMGLAVFSPTRLIGQWEDYNHPELRWFTITTPHFEVHFHEGVERTAREVARIAEQVYGPITELYDYHPEGKVHFIIRDHDDNSNGAAYYYDQKIEIWAPALDFELRGNHEWLPNVVTHEFSHLISLGAARKFSRKVPGFYFQWIQYEKERRPDVIYGYPNVIVSYPVAGTVVPMWFAEGMAQYQRAGIDHDFWDTHRDMLLRTAVLSDSLLSLNDMSVFGKDGLGNERVYNQGFALTLYISKTYGEETVARLARALRSPLALSFDAACRKVLGKSADDLYSEWRSFLENRYRSATRKIVEARVEGKLLWGKGILNLHPRFSPDGTKIAFVSSRGAGYFSSASLCVLDVKTRKCEVLVPGVGSPASWTPDGQKLVYAKLHRVNSHGSHYFDLYEVDVRTRRSKRLTTGLRAYAPAISPDGDWIACITQRDGTQNLTLVSRDGKRVRQVTHFENGETLFTPVWIPDGRGVVVAVGREHGRYLAVIDTAKGGMRTLLDAGGDARDPAFSPDGKYLYFAWDRTGIFNIYRMEWPNGHPEPVTNVVGGAFTPSVASNGSLAFSIFRADGYKLASLAETLPLPEDHLSYGLPTNWLSPEAALAGGTNGDAVDVTDPRPYSAEYGQIFFLPRLLIDYGLPKIGLYLYSSEILERLSFLAGGALNREGDFDLFGIFEYRRFAPTVFLELYALSRHLDERIEVLENYPKVETRIRFNLLEADIGLRQRLSDALRASVFLRHSRYTSHIGKFFFQNQLWVSPKNTYYIGTEAFLKLDLDLVARTVDASVAPRGGRRVELQLGHHRNNFFKDFSTDNPYGTLQEVYTPYRYFSAELDWREYVGLPIPGHSLAVRLRGGWIDRPVDSFFNFFAGGLPGLKGYPYYSIEGRKLLHLGLTYRFPLARDLDFALGPVQAKRAYLGLFAESGNAFDQDSVPWSDFRTDAGIQLRVQAYAFYAYPTMFFFDAAYGFSRFQHLGQTYGREWRFYFGIAFDFLDE